jgi:hypothetical protein
MQLLELVFVQVPFQSLLSASFPRLELVSAPPRISLWEGCHWEHYFAFKDNALKIIERFEGGSIIWLSRLLFVRTGK